MALAQDNLPAAGVGYEIFDKSDAFGTTAFVQNINKSRALEGELSRSIQTIEGIEAARVHLVIPEKQIFSRDEQQPSASVVLKTRGRLDRGQVTAIQHLVAAAVAAMSADRVAIVDDRGNMLAAGDDKSGPDALARNQDEDTTNYENSLRQRIESIVTSVVGTGHVQVQVAADINYNHTQTTNEKYDPDGKVVRSSQTVERNASDSAGGGAAVSVAKALPGGASNGGDTSKNHQLRNFQDRHHLDRRWRRCEEAVGGRGRGWQRRNRRQLQAPQRRRNGQDHRSGEVGHGLRPDARRPGAGLQHAVRPRRHR
jgi:flagellar M-ring protein FliF